MLTEPMMATMTLQVGLIKLKQKLPTGGEFKAKSKGVPWPIDKSWGSFSKSFTEDMSIDLTDAVSQVAAAGLGAPDLKHTDLLVFKILKK